METIRDLLGMTIVVTGATSGMGREKFAHSRMFIEYDDETTVGTCGMHCAVIDLI